MSHLAVIELPPGRHDQAYPLARLLAPQLTLAAWRRHLVPSSGPPRPGVLAVENRRGVLLGLAVYRLGHSLLHGRCLESDPLMVFDLLAGERVAETLLAALERRARELACESLAANLLTAATRRARPLGLAAALPDTPLLRGCRAQGYRIEGARLCKPLTARADD